MDPNTTLSEFQSALRVGRIDEARELATSLSEWLSNGGFAPNGLSGVTGSPSVKDWHAFYHVFMSAMFIS